MHADSAQAILNAVLGIESSLKRLIWFLGMPRHGVSSDSAHNPFSILIWLSITEDLSKKQILNPAFNLNTKSNAVRWINWTFQKHMVASRPNDFFSSLYIRLFLYKGKNSMSLTHFNAIAFVILTHAALISAAEILVASLKTLFFSSSLAAKEIWITRNGSYCTTTRACDEPMRPGDKLRKNVGDQMRRPSNPSIRLKYRADSSQWMRVLPFIPFSLSYIS